MIAKVQRRIPAACRALAFSINDFDDIIGVLIPVEPAWQFDILVSNGLDSTSLPK
ncbi:MAG TPA: hypothetical protein VND64_22635 [Pirellulales bacterium]|nr:hypothetical protein [Pirellulales bacterium]